jgi:selenocysteine-specific elongation factor
MTLPNGEEVGIVDVPGHRDFIENMLSGIGGIDAVLLVIAADEGVMPQTREHLAILDLLQIPAGLIVLTKTDLAPDPTWLDLVETDIRATVSATVLRDAPIFRVSAKTKTGLDSLVSNLQSLLIDKPSRPDLGRPRLPIDRVFSMIGFGTVVTGTLLDGHLALDDEVQLLPSGQRGRIRGLQTHKKKEETAIPGSRTAVNISGVEIESIPRGEVVVHPNQYQATRRIDARFRLLNDASSALKHNTEVKFFAGASETIATLRLLGTEELHPGEEGWIQLELRQPIVAVRGDRYILRRPSPGETLGGGVIVDPQPKGRHKRFDDTVLRSLESLSQGTPADILLEAALALRLATAKEIAARSRLESASAQTALTDLLNTGSLIALEAEKPTSASDLLLMPRPYWHELQEKIIRTVEAHHKKYPLRRGIQREELKSKLRLSTRDFHAILRKLITDGYLLDSSTILAKPEHEVRFDRVQMEKVQVVMRRFEQTPYSPPSVKDVQAALNEEILNALMESGQLVTVSSEVLFRRQDYDVMVNTIQQEIRQKGRITLSEVRDLFNTSRKYAQALLEHLDTIGVTTRVGDFRTLQ